MTEEPHNMILDQLRAIRARPAVRDKIF